MAQTFTHPSSSSDTQYVMVLHEDGHLSCNCKGWTMKKPGKPRLCSGMKDHIAKAGWVTEVRDDQLVYVISKEAGMAAKIVPPAPAPSTPTSRFIEPMLAVKMPTGRALADYCDGRYTLERKWDGERRIVAKHDIIIEAWARPQHGSRVGNKHTLPDHIMEAMQSAADGVYDCELIIPGGYSSDVKATAHKGKEQLVIFDLLVAMDKPIMSMPYRERRDCLKVALLKVDLKGNAIRLSEQLTPSEKAIAAIYKAGGEGGILKRVDAAYRPGHRTDSWIKVVQKGTEIITITGFEHGESGPHSTVVGKDKDGIEAKVKTRNNATLRLLEQNARQYLGTRLVITYKMKTPSGKYRHAMFDHFAGDDEE